MVSSACPAIINASYASGAGAQAWGTSEIDNVNTQYSSWWCSNGIYKKVTTAGSAVELNANQELTGSQNARLELALVGCPQGATMCNSGSTMATDLATASTTATFTMPVSTMTLTSKCTWVAYSTIAGPTFVFGESAASLGLVGSNWEIHAMEYTASTTTSFLESNGSLVPGAGAGLIKEAEALDAGNYTPLFTMPA